MMAIPLSIPPREGGSPDCILVCAAGGVLCDNGFFPVITAIRIMANVKTREASDCLTGSEKEKRGGAVWGDDEVEEEEEEEEEEDEEEDEEEEEDDDVEGDDDDDDEM